MCMAKLMIEPCLRDTVAVWRRFLKFHIPYVDDDAYPLVHDIVREAVQMYIG